ncbi:trypsin-like peptidase domain-containing protein [Streptomyces actuosus]|uniref:Trypsin-like peptidase domain-containing protein n=1 Tax=Streptomyces actuosus TaxID=1885 RepID=A0ABS2VQH5_STRAS|nr:serine protease [Streptomyces actuosus]MBN0045326.1 trypsin-like peptidase domain-containing protein [Streptomyces actuosus]
MNKPLLAALAALVITGAGAAPAMAAPERAAAPSAPTASTAAQTSTASAAGAPTLRAVDFAGTVALSNCSGSVIRFPDSADNARALVLTNGHCLETGFPEPGEVVVDQSSRRSFSLLNSSGYRIGTLRADKVVYSTMTDTDVTIYETTRTYAQIRSWYGIEALTVADTHPVAGTAITVASGYWRRLYNCNIDGFVYRLKEGDWTWKDSVRYTSSCNTIGGTSGSPVIDQATGKVVAVNNTGNEDGQTCTVNNPCEVDENGNVTVREGINYAEETYQIPACFTSGNRLDLSASGCVLPKP